MLWSVVNFWPHLCEAALDIPRNFVLAEFLSLRLFRQSWSIFALANRFELPYGSDVVARNRIWSDL